MQKSKSPSARPVVDAARRGDRKALAALHAQGADLNGIWRGYRALHALIQEEPHAAAARADKGRLGCLRWLLAHGADPELPGAWPPARALLVAAFRGEPGYVAELREHGAKVDFFVRCALGELPAVKKALLRSPALARERDGGTLTALHCVSASRMGHADPKTGKKLLAIAEWLLDAGAEPNAAAQSWSHEVDACYFACGSSQPELLDLLLARGADATAALPSAAWRKTMELAEICLAHGAKIDAARAEGRPLLNELVRWGQVTPALWQMPSAPQTPDTRGSHSSPSSAPPAQRQVPKLGSATSAAPKPELMMTRWCEFGSIRCALSRV